MIANRALSPLQYQAKTDTNASVRTSLAHTAGNLDLLAFRINDGATRPLEFLKDPRTATESGVGFSA